MRIDRFSSKDFRNLKHEPLSFCPGVNVIVGDNGHGKTNLLEAIYFFKFARSFRTSRDAEVIRYGEPFSRIEVQTETSSGDGEFFEAAIERNGAKRIKVNGNDVARYSELVGRYPSVLFGPHDLALSSGHPAERRRYLDMVGSLTDRVYLEELRAYRRVLGHRNAALKMGKPEAMGVWTEELIGRGSRVVEKRLRLVDALRVHMASDSESLEIRDATDLVYDSELTRQRPDDVGIEQQFAARLAAVEIDELRRGTTLVGPHRDDLRLLMGGRDLRRYGSQGQRRLVAVLLRLAELAYVEERLREPCVLLLDDLFSELDHRVSAKLKRKLHDKRQVFVTSPVEVAWDETASETFRVADGEVTRESGTPGPS